MLKNLGDLIHRTSWKALLGGGFFVLIGLVLFTVPIRLMRLSDAGKTPQERSAIKREINLAFGDRALTIAESVVKSMKARSADPERIRDLDAALSEMERARRELDRARSDVGRAVGSAGSAARESASEATEAAVQTATDAAEAAVEAAVDGAALEGKAVTKRPPTKIIIFDDPDRKSKPKVSIHIDGGPELNRITLTPEARREIREKVAGDVWRVGVGSALIVLYVPLLMMVVLAKYWIGRSRRAFAFAEEKKQEAIVSDSNRQITEARLQALQAQIEPHFLYNTLANVQALTEIDPPAATAMVGHLIQYLRAALPKMRESTSTIGQEVELIRAYLNILKMRMGDRLEFGIDVPQDLSKCPFPPMMLLSLVENAIKHGLETLREGGRIDVLARRATIAGKERLQVEVRDNGRGLTDIPTLPGAGVGLTNLRERLLALHGGNARFTLEANTPRGAVATIEVPMGAAFADTLAAQGGQDMQAQSAAPNSAAPPSKGWKRWWRATRSTHSVWASIMTKVFFGLMFLLAVGFALSLIALYSGWMPINVGPLALEGIEGKALGSVMLLAGFVISTIVVAMLVAMFYGLGFLFAALLIIVPAAILVSVFPVLAPFVLVGVIIWWLWRRRRRRRIAAAAAAAPGSAASMNDGSSAPGTAAPPRQH